MSKLLTEFSRYIKKHERLKEVDKKVFVLLFKVFVEFLNNKHYKITYMGRKNVRKQV